MATFSTKDGKKICHEDWDCRAMPGPRNSIPGGHNSRTFAVAPVFRRAKNLEP